MALACCVFRACCLCISLEIRRLIPIRYSSRSNLPAASGMLWGKGRQEGVGPEGAPPTHSRVDAESQAGAVSQPMGTGTRPVPDPVVATPGTAAPVRQGSDLRVGLHPGSCLGAGL